MSRNSFSDEQIAEIRNAFSMFDNEKGVISHVDIIEVMKRLGQNPSEEEVLKMIEPIDKNGDQKVEFHEFAEMMRNYLQQIEPQHENEVIKNMFQLFDKNDNGYICMKELRKMLKTMGEKVSHKQVNEMMKFADRNGDGHIDFEEFKNLVNEVLVTDNVSLFLR
eukprot:TCONS_00073269-protein